MLQRTERPCLPRGAASTVKVGIPPN